MPITMADTMTDSPFQHTSTLTSAQDLLAFCEAQSGINKLLAVVAALRHPQLGCPWDLKQTHASLRPYMLEEAYEAVEAIDTGHPAPLQEELGDVLLQVALHAQLAMEAGTFTFPQVAEGIANKLIERHPHVFGQDMTNLGEAATPEAVVTNWEAMKRAKHGEKTGQPASAMDTVPEGVPALIRAFKASKKAVHAGFKWPSFESLWSCVLSEYDELRQDIDNERPIENLEDELGDCLFATVSLAQFLGIDAEVALHKATNKFMSRYRAMEQLLDQPLESYSFETLDDAWRQAKKQVAQQS